MGVCVWTETKCRVWDEGYWTVWCLFRAKERNRLNLQPRPGRNVVVRQKSKAKHHEIVCLEMCFILLGKL